VCSDAGVRFSEELNRRADQNRISGRLEKKISESDIRSSGAKNIGIGYPVVWSKNIRIGYPVVWSKK
jgi:hypothetical protein